MELSPLSVMLLLISLIPVVQAQRSPKAVVSIKPDTHVFTGEIVTLRCDIQGGGNTQWTYRWYKDNNKLYSNGNKRKYIDNTMQVLIISYVGDSDSGTYTCRGHGRYYQSSEISDDVILTVSVEKQKTNQTSERNQNQSGAEDSQSGHTPLQAGSANIYDIVDESDMRGTGEAAAESNTAIYTQVMKKKKANRNNGADADVTYAEIELKPMLKTKRIKETTNVGDETVYSEVRKHMK